MLKRSFPFTSFYFPFGEVPSPINNLSLWATGTTSKPVIPEESKDKLVTESKLDRQLELEISPTRDSSSQVNSPVKILKSESTFAKSFGQRNSTSNETKKLQFADEAGSQLAENVFIDQLHYSTNNSTVPEGTSKGCCVIS